MKTSLPRPRSVIPITEFSLLNGTFCALAEV
jgi:hypothetical protein